ncbi:MAG: hypothetical protein V4662_24845 [Verrucomicrobiota bacterium]
MKTLLFLAAVFLPLLAQAQQHLTWQQRTDVGSPGPRGGSAMAYDEIREVTLLYGGDLNTGVTPGTYVHPQDPLMYNQHDLWKYDGVQWTQMTVTGTLPLTSVEAAMVFHPGLQRVILMGGNSFESDRNIMWSFVFDTPSSGHWIIEDTNVPMNYGALGLAYDYSRQVLVIVGAGGFRDIQGRETWEWDTAVWTQKALMPPVQAPYAIHHWRPCFAYHAASGKLVLAHDQAVSSGPAGAVTTTHTFNGTTWTQMPTGALAPPLGTIYVNANREMVYDSQRQRLVAVDSTSSYDFDGVNWRVAGPNSNFPNGPGTAGGLSVRQGTCIAFDKKRGVLVRYGGGNQTVPGQNYNTFAETWELRRASTAIQLVNPNVSSINPLVLCATETLQLHLLVTIGNGPNSSTGIAYEWFKDGAPVSGAPGQPWLYLKNNATTADTGIYQARATDAWGNRVESNPVNVFVHNYPSITQQPQSRRLIPGESFALQGAYNSTLPANVWWTKDGVTIPGATSLTYSKTNVTLADAGEYRLNVQVPCVTVQSNAAIISVGPRIVSQPVFPVNPNAGNTPVTMVVTGDGAGALGTPYTVGADPTLYPNRLAPNDGTTPQPMTFTWRYEGTPISNGAKYTITNTALTSSLQINQPDYEYEGRYDCVVTDASGLAYAKITNQQELILRPLAPPYLTLLQSRGPEPRSYSGMEYDSQRRRTVLFGGEAYGVNPRSGNANVGLFSSNDTWEWDGQVWVRRNPVNRPPPTSNFGIAYDSARGRTVIFGGYKDMPPNYLPGYEVITNDVWEWDGVNWMQITPPSSPPARLAPVMCYDSIRGEILMLGGVNLTPEPADFYGSRKILWGWNGVQWTQRGLVPGGNTEPYIGGYHAMAFDPGRGVAVLFGHFGTGSYPVWEWNGTLWTQVMPPLDVRVMESRSARNAFYDPVRRRIGLPVVSNDLFPSVGPSVPTIVWWNGVSFMRGDTGTLDDINGTALTGVEAGPFGQDRDLGVFDLHRRCFVWHDSPAFVNTAPSFTRELHFSAKVKPVHQPVEVFFATSQNIQLRSIHAGQRPLTHQWYKEGSALPESAHTAGVATPTLTINAATAADSGTYRVNVSNAMNSVVGRDIRLILQNSGVGTVVQGMGLVLSWPGATGILETAPAPNGPWTAVHGATPPYSVAMDEASRFYRVRYP